MYMGDPKSSRCRILFVGGRMKLAAVVRGWYDVRYREDGDDRQGTLPQAV
jgi:hypothetical protein